MTKDEKAAKKRHKLRACPFCGDTNPYKDVDGYWGFHFIRCGNSNCVKGPERMSTVKAAKAWNGVK